MERCAWPIPLAFPVAWHLRRRKPLFDMDRVFGPGLGERLQYPSRSAAALSSGLGSLEVRRDRRAWPIRPSFSVVWQPRRRKTAQMAREDTNEAPGPQAPSAPRASVPGQSACW
jgi:hypothetical protein